MPTRPVACVCVRVCLFVVLKLLKALSPWPRKFIFGMQVSLQNLHVKFTGAKTVKSRPTTPLVTDMVQSFCSDVKSISITNGMWCYLQPCTAPWAGVCRVQIADLQPGMRTSYFRSADTDRPYKDTAFQCMLFVGGLPLIERILQMNLIIVQRVKKDSTAVMHECHTPVTIMTTRCFLAQKSTEKSS